MRKNYFLNKYNVSRETLEKLEYFHFLFLKWSKKINLVSSSTVDFFWERHVEDSLRIFQLHPYPSTWIDLGSGGGFPGIVTSIQLASIGGGLVNLVESNNKKASFLRYVIQKTEARGKVFHCRIQDAYKIITKCDVISARALASLDNLLEYSFPWLSKNVHTKAFFYKGCNYELEIYKAKKEWNFSFIKHNSLVKNDSIVLEISHVNRILKS
ncbi:16S rRNA (guanine(527)-N(7))-methyltransferase RsmG [Candidatus Liberibacter brunswickensis]|uniref:16S rRNA (guanine(527)-N(7))-methyltransferase RsmG n=1 Tax=Candidatus Liberibacter brunswickensis TaxID=1968796 RepID=UPI002FE32570